jgi:hypothetical protein
LSNTFHFTSTQPLFFNFNQLQRTAALNAGHGHSHSTSNIAISIATAIDFSNPETVRQAFEHLQAKIQLLQAA